MYFVGIPHVVNLLGPGARHFLKAPHFITADSTDGASHVRQNAQAASNAQLQAMANNDPVVGGTWVSPSRARVPPPPPAAGYES